MVIEPQKENQEIALVTGASRGIGRAVAQGLGSKGCFVYLNYQSNEEAAQESLEAVRTAGGDGELLPFDVTDEKATNEAIKKIFADKKRLDILVNNAGIRDDMLMVWMKKANWERVLDTNLTGFFKIGRAHV